MIAITFLRHKMIAIKFLRHKMIVITFLRDKIIYNFLYCIYCSLNHCNNLIVIFSSC